MGRVFAGDNLQANERGYIVVAKSDLQTRYRRRPFGEEILRALVFLAKLLAVFFLLLAILLYFCLGLYLLPFSLSVNSLFYGAQCVGQRANIYIYSLAHLFFSGVLVSVELIGKLFFSRTQPYMLYIQKKRKLIIILRHPRVLLKRKKFQSQANRRSFHFGSLSSQTCNLSSSYLSLSRLT